MVRIGSRSSPVVRSMGDDARGGIEEEDVDIVASADATSGMGGDLV